RPMPGLTINEKTVIDSHYAMIIDPLPKRLLIIGAGAIGVEFAYFFNAFGTEVTLIEMLPNLLPVEDTEISVALERAFAKQGIKFFTNTKVTESSADKNGARITLEGKKKETLESDCALVAIGVTPLVPKGVDLKLDKKGYIQV